MKTTVYTRGKTKAKISGDHVARHAIEGFDKDTGVTGLTNGAFSLISLIGAVLEVTGPADVLVSTWSAGFYDLTAIEQLMQSGNILDFRMILDRSFATRKESYKKTVDELFAPEKIRTTNMHSKFVLIKNDEWSVTIRSSMNLNENKRCENFDLDNNEVVYNLFSEFAADLFAKQMPGVIESRSIVDPVFDTLFPLAQIAPKKKDFDFSRMVARFGD